jgi:hypothetical protein
MLENNLSVIQIGKRAQRTIVVAYADDVAVFVTAPNDFKFIHSAIRLYERASGARLYPKKSKAWQSEDGIHLQRI